MLEKPKQSNILETFVLAALWRPDGKEEYGAITCLTVLQTTLQYTEARYLEIKFHKKIRILIASSSSSPLSFALVFIVRTLVLQKNKKLNRLEHKILIAINTIIIFIFIIPGIALFHV